MPSPQWVIVSPKRKRRAQPNDGRSRRGRLCREVMEEFGLASIIEASVYVKRNGLRPEDGTGALGSSKKGVLPHRRAPKSDQLCDCEQSPPSAAAAVEVETVASTPATTSSVNPFAAPLPAVCVAEETTEAEASEQKAAGASAPSLTATFTSPSHTPTPPAL
jgi:hypothetical protein